MRGGYYKCKGKCETLKYGNKPLYEYGDKFCRKICCASYRDFTGIYCPCCMSKLATKTKKKRQTALKQYKKYRMPNEIDFQTMSLPQLMVKYPRVKDRY